MNKLIEVKNLAVNIQSKTKNINVVHNINIEIAEKEIVCLVGESGSGKTVTSYALMRLIDYEGGVITDGEVLFNGINLVDKSLQQMNKLRGNDVSIIFQDATNALDPLYTIGHQITDVIRQHKKLSYKEAYEQGLKLLEQVKIADPVLRMKQYPHELSGGMLQRIMIAIALACEPKLLIADEPTTALDVTIQAQIIALLKELRDSLNMAILFITHDLGVTAQLADRVVVMYAGEIVEQGDVKHIFNKPRHPYTEALLHSVKAYEQRTNALYTIKGTIPPLSNMPSGCRFSTRCDFVTAKCHEQRPPITTEGKHQFSCWHPVVKDKKYTLIFEDSVFVQKRNGRQILQAKNLTKYFTVNSELEQKKTVDIKAVDDVSLQLFEGEVFSLVGESGSGKSTLGRLLLQLEKANSGELLFEQKNIFELKGTALKKIKSDMQVVFQDPTGSMNPKWTLEKIIDEPLQVHTKLSKKERRQKIKETLTLVGLNENWLTKYPHELSGGQKQRVSIARAIILQPKFVLLDEAVSALDVSVQSQIVSLLKTLQQQQHITFLFIAHGLDVVHYISDRIGVMYLGKLVEVGPAEEVFNRPKHPYTKALIEANPVINPNIKTIIEPLKGEVPSPAYMPTGCRFHTRCELATELCKTEQPKELQFGERMVACHWPLGTQEEEI